MCKITIEKVQGLSPAAYPKFIVISGTAEDCDLIRVLLACGAGPSEQFGTVQKGNWSVVFAGDDVVTAECKCGETARVHAECVTDSTCFDDWSAALECK